MFKNVLQTTSCGSFLWQTNNNSARARLHRWINPTHSRPDHVTTLTSAKQQFNYYPTTVAIRGTCRCPPMRKHWKLMYRMGQKK